MKYFSSIFCTFLILLSLGFAKDVELGKEEQTSIIYNSQVYDLNDNPVHQDPNQSREQIDLILEDFETTAGDWDASDGWTTSTTEYHSETTSYHSADYLPVDDNGEPTYKSWDLFSPLYTLPELGDGETMHFDFWLNLDMPGAECDGDGFLDDYYGISILDIDDTGFLDINSALKNKPISQTKVCCAGDILVSCLNPRKWRALLVPNIFSSVSCSNEFLVITPKNKIDPLDIYFSLF